MTSICCCIWGKGNPFAVARPQTDGIIADFTPKEKRIDLHYGQGAYIMTNGTNHKAVMGAAVAAEWEQRAENGPFD